MTDKENKINPVDVLQKALKILDSSLDGRIVNPDSLSTAIQMSQYMWLGVYSTDERERVAKEALRNSFDDTIQEKEIK